MKTFVATLIAALLINLAVALGSAAQTKKANRVFEMRTYYAAPGKMEALHARFRNHTNKLFVKHGMDLVGYWSPVDAKQAEEKMVYILAYPNMEAAKKSWKDFAADPDWKAAKAMTEKDGKLVDKA